MNILLISYVNNIIRKNNAMSNKFILYNNNFKKFNKIFIMNWFKRPKHKIKL